MKLKFIEVTNGPMNWGKFAVGMFTYDDWKARSAVSESMTPHLAARGWTPGHYMVLDLQTGEGAIFKIGGHVKADLDKHAIWVCPMFEPFLEWLYKQDMSKLDSLPAHVDLPDAPFAMSGYRRKGPDWHDEVLVAAQTAGLPLGDEVGQYYWRPDINELVRRNANGTDTVWTPERTLDSRRRVRSGSRT